MFHNLRILSLFLLAALLLSFPALSQKVFYVTPTGSGANDGSSWAAAYAGTQLQVAIDAASTYWQDHQSETVEVWVAQGIYKPTTGTVQNIHFSMRDHVAIYGGFVGTEDQLSQRPAITLSTPSSTTLSGEIGEPGYADNSFCVVRNRKYSDDDGVSQSAVLDGFVIADGYTDGGYGSGMSNSDCSPTIRNCSFRNNRSGRGGAVSNNGENENIVPRFINCSFIDNVAEGVSGASYGGAVYNVGDLVQTCNPLFLNCLFLGNVAADKGGALVSGFNTNLELVNCTFVNNLAPEYGGIFHTNFGPSPSTKVTNCVFWNNGGEKTFNLAPSAQPTLTASYSLFEPSVIGYTGSTNQLLASLPFASEANLQLTACSPAVNAGDPNSTSATSGSSDLEGNPRFVGGRIDIGAFEFQGELAITQPPVSASTVCAGSAITVPVAATATTAITYQWLKDNSPLTPAQNTATLSLTGVQTQDAGSYVLLITTACESLTTTAFQLTVNATPAPVLSLSPAIPQPILQNTPFVSLTITACEGGTIRWQGPNSTSGTGTGTTISVPTSTTGTLVYSATCTLNSCVSPAGSFTVTISPPSTTGNFDGFIYGADCGTFRGWTWDRGKPNTVQSVDILDGATFIETIPANEFRQDLKDAGKGNGIHAFRWTIPESLKDGQVHYLSARVAGSSFFLKDSPKALVCAGTGSPVNKAPVPPSPTILIAPLTAQVGVPFSATLVAFTDPEAAPLTYALSGLPAGLSLNASTRVISGTPTEAGSFALAYSASDGLLTNSVSFPLTVNPVSTTTVTGSFEGYLDKVECGTIRGWVWDRNKPNTPVSVEFYTGSTVWGSVVANIYRVDLLNAGKGNGAHAYSFEVPAALKDGVTRSIRARVLGSSYDLKDSGKPLTCGSPARLSAEAGSELQVRVLGNPVSDQVVVEIRGAQGQPLRVQLTDASGRLVTERQIGEAQAIEEHTLSVQGKPAGLLLLRMSSGQKTVTVKVMKY